MCIFIFSYERKHIKNLKYADINVCNTDIHCLPSTFHIYETKTSKALE